MQNYGAIGAGYDQGKRLAVFRFPYSLRISISFLYFFSFHTGDICHFSSMKKNIVIHCYSLIILRANSVNAIEDTEVKTKLQTYVKLLFITTKGILCNFVDVIIICRWRKCLQVCMDVRKITNNRIKLFCIDPKSKSFALIIGHPENSMPSVLHGLFLRWKRDLFLVFVLPWKEHNFYSLALSKFAKVSGGYGTLWINHSRKTWKGNWFK